MEMEWKRNTQYEGTGRNNLNIISAGYMQIRPEIFPGMPLPYYRN